MFSHLNQFAMAVIPGIPGEINIYGNEQSKAILQSKY